MKRSLVLFLFPLFALAEFSVDSEVGHQFAYRFYDKEITRNRPYLLLKGKYQYSKKNSEITVVTSGRGWLDRRENELDLRSLNLGWAKGKTNVVVGLQEIPWGETFGIFIADIINPRDLRDPFFNDLSWIRQPVFAINGQWVFNKLTLQVVFTPVPRNNRFPHEMGGVGVLEPKEFEPKRIGKDSEGGLRVDYLFDSGFDVNLFYYTHYNRNPVFELTMVNGIPELAPVVERIHTCGITFSQALEKWVFRGDGVLHFQSPYQASATDSVKRVLYWRSILGADFTSTDTSSIGFQYHFDQAEGDPRHWIGARIEKKLFRDKLILEAFAFQGMGNADTWIQPKITWLFATDFSASIQGDIIANKSSRPGYLAAFQNEDRILTWLSFKF